MLRVVIILTAVWSLAATPALCRAGVLDGCCDSAAGEPVAELSAPCLSDPTPCEHESHPMLPGEQRCVSCSAVCGGFAKPTEEVGSNELPPPVLCSDLHDELTGSQRDAFIFAPLDDSAHRVRLPIARSDIPLLI